MIVPANLPKEAILALICSNTSANMVPSAKGRGQDKNTKSEWFMPFREREIDTLSKVYPKAPVGGLQIDKNTLARTKTVANEARTKHQALIDKLKSLGVPGL